MSRRKLTVKHKNTEIIFATHYDKCMMNLERLTTCSKPRDNIVASTSHHSFSPRHLKLAVPLEWLCKKVWAWQVCAFPCNCNESLTRSISFSAATAVQCLKTLFAKRGVHFAAVLKHKLHTTWIIRSAVEKHPERTTLEIYSRNNPLRTKTIRNKHWRGTVMMTILICESTAPEEQLAWYMKVWCS